MLLRDFSCWLVCPFSAQAFESFGARKKGAHLACHDLCKFRDMAAPFDLEAVPSQSEEEVAPIAPSFRWGKVAKVALAAALGLGLVGLLGLGFQNFGVFQGKSSLTMDTHQQWQQQQQQQQHMQMAPMIGGMPSAQQLQQLEQMEKMQHKGGSMGSMPQLEKSISSPELMKQWQIHMSHMGHRPGLAMTPPSGEQMQQLLQQMQMQMGGQMPGHHQQ